MPAGNNLGSCYLWRNFATGGNRSGNEYDVYVPYERLDDGTIRYGMYTFMRIVSGTTGVMHLAKIKLGLPVLNIWHAAHTKVGTWTTTVDTARIPNDGILARSSTAGDYIEGSVTGHTVFVRYATITNGGFGLVSLDGDFTAAKMLPAVKTQDFATITAALNNVDGTWTFTTSAAHGFSTGASIIIEDTVGLTGANATHLNITVLTATTFKVTATITGTWTSGGTVGYFSQADLGKRYIDFYGVGPYYNEWAPLAQGLTDGAHTVRVVVKGTARLGGGSGNQRVYVSSFAAARGTTTIGTADVDMAYLYEALDFRQLAASSALVTAILYAPAADPANFQFLGDIHGNENAVSFDWKVDGEIVDIPRGSFRAGTQIEFVRKTEYVHPGTGSTVIAKVDTHYIARAGRASHITATQRITWLVAGTNRDAYQGMLSAGLTRRRGGAIDQPTFNRARLNDRIIEDLTANNDTQVSDGAAAEGEFYSTDSDLHMSVVIDPAKNVNNWRQSTTDFAWLQDRSDGVDKLYFSRSTAAAPEPVAVNDAHDNETGWSIWVQRSTDGPFLVPASRLENDAFGVGRKEADAQLNQETVAAAGTTPTFLARIVNRRNCAALDPLQIKSVSYSIVEKLESNPSYSRAVATNVAVQPYECLFATLQTDCAWGGLDSTGYNFKLIPAAGALPSSGYTYVVTVTLTPRSGPAFQIRYRVRTI